MLSGRIVGLIIVPMSGTCHRTWNTHGTWSTHGTCTWNGNCVASCIFFCHTLASGWHVWAWRFCHTTPSTGGRGPASMTRWPKIRNFVKVNQSQVIPYLLTTNDICYNFDQTGNQYSEVCSYLLLSGKVDICQLRFWAEFRRPTHQIEHWICRWFSVGNDAVAHNIFTVVCKKVHKIWSVWCKMALGKVDVSLPWWCHALVLLAPGYWRLFLNLKSLVHNGKLTNFRGILVKVEILKFQQFYLMKFKVSILTKDSSKTGDFFMIWKKFKIWKKTSLTWSQKDKGVASSWEWHAYFS